MAKTKKQVVPFSQVLDALTNLRQPFPVVHLHRFSDLAGNDLAQFKKVWPKVDPDRKFAMMEDLEELVETDTLVSFDELARFSLRDADARVRASALRLLWENEDARLIPTFLEMMEKDPDAVVRASAASALGLFVYKGELEELSPERLKLVEDHLLAVENGADQPLVRRRALESLGYSSREEVSDLIRQAYANEDKEWQASALFAMGRSADEKWEKDILGALDSRETEVELEAVRASGQLELESARTRLIRKLDHADELDDEVRLAVAWSLSQIGGENVRSVLEKLLEGAEDDAEADTIDLALENLSLREEIPGFSMFDPLASIEDHTQIVDLSQEEEEDEDDLVFPEDFEAEDDEA